VDVLDGVMGNYEVIHETSWEKFIYINRYYVCEEVDVEVIVGGGKENICKFNKP